METETFSLGPLTMYVSDDHRFGTDAFLLAYYANVKPDSVVCDLCTGCGIIPLIFCKNVKPHLIYAVDIQEEAIELLKKSVETNHLENTLQPILADLRELDQSQIGFETMDIVTANPPYMTSGSGFEKLARFVWSFCIRKDLILSKPRWLKAMYCDPLTFTKRIN